MRSTLLLLLGLLVSAQAQSLVNLSVNPATLQFTYQKSSALPAPQTISVTDDGFITFAVSNVFQSPWLTITPDAGVVPATLQVAVNPLGLSAGVYDAQIQVFASNGNGPPPIRVRLTVVDAPRLIAIPSVLSFTYQA